MKKAAVISVISILILLVGFFSYIKINPPLEVGVVATSNDTRNGNHVVVIEIGNKGIGKMKIKEVLIDGEKKPKVTNMHVSHALKGIIVTDKLEEDDKKDYEITRIEDVVIQPNTAPSTNLDKLNNGTASKKDTIYGIGVIDDKAVHTVYVKYDYLGILFEKVVEVK